MNYKSAEVPHKLDNRSTVDFEVFVKIASKAPKSIECGVILPGEASTSRPGIVVAYPVMSIVFGVIWLSKEEAS